MLVAQLLKPPPSLDLEHLPIPVLLSQQLPTLKTSQISPEQPCTRQLLQIENRGVRVGNDGLFIAVVGLLTLMLV